VNILCITHADFETPGIIETWAIHNGYGFTVKKPYSGDILTGNESYDALIIMGGPQSSVSIKDFPYLQAEVSFIEKAAGQNKKILGFCLGAQLIGLAVGAKPEQSPEKEVGVYPLQLTPQAGMDPLLAGFPETFPVIHWHNDMPGMTQESTLLAYSAGCPRQIIRYKPNIYGFQCHMEITLEGIKRMVQAVPEDLQPPKFTQAENELLRQDYSTINAQMEIILDRFADI